MTRLGIWPFAALLAVIAAARIGAIFFHGEPPRMRALFGGVGLVALTVVAVWLLGIGGLLSGNLVFGGLVAMTAGLSLWRRDRTLGIPWRSLVGIETAPLAFVATCAVLIAALAAYWLPVWQWDSLGYHLPYVNFVLQGAGFSDVPRDVPYLSTYPHDVELVVIAWRALLANDTLVDAVQIPFGLLGAGAVACLARELRAPTKHAVAAGLFWLTLPAVFLQLPTNYIDVAAAALLLAGAAFTMAPPTSRNILGAGIALGLFLGSKPNAPVGTTLLLVVLAWRAWKSGERRAFAGALGIIVVLGAGSYLANILRHGNPIWPVKLKLGPLALPGTYDMQELLDSGALVPRLHGFVLWRVLRSWISFDAPPMFDMHYGGLGLAFLLGIPLAVRTAIMRKEWILVLIALATLASPDPAVPRYILAFPGLVLALAAASLPADLRLRRLGFAVATLATALLLYRAYPALAGEGPPLGDYARMTSIERERSVGADGPPRDFRDALARLGPGEATAFDASFHLPYLAWPDDLSHASTRIPDDVDRAGAERLLADKHVRLLIVDPRSPVAAIARSRGGEFIELFQCKSSTCIVLLRS